MSIPFSVLDLMPTRPDDSHAQTMRKTVQAAQAAERFGFNRFWVAEHHNAGSLLSSATVVVMMAELRITVEAVAAPTMAIVMPAMKTAVSAKAKLRVLVREVSEACSEQMD